MEIVTTGLIVLMLIYHITSHAAAFTLQQSRRLAVPRTAEYNRRRGSAR